MACCGQSVAREAKVPVIRTEAMFLALPEDLSVVLLSEWLESRLSDLSHLDVACCNRASRSCWLQVLRQVQVHRTTDAAYPFFNFLKWLHDRNVLVHSLRVEMKEEYGEKLSKLSLSFRTTSLRETHTLPVRSETIQTLLSCFPCLTSLDLHCRQLLDGFFPDLSYCPPLRQLRLRDCWNTNMSNANMLLVRVGVTLEDLHCDFVDELMVMTLTQHCKALRKLSCIFPHTVTAEAIVALCSNNSQLTHVDFSGKHVTNDVILSILAACPNMRDVALGVRCKVTYDLLSAPAVQELDRVSLWPFDLRFSPCEAGGSRRCCEMAVNADTGFLSALIAISPLLIRAITFSDGQYVVVATPDVLRALADFHGWSLEKCKLNFWDDVKQDDVQYFLSRCPNMVDLSLTSSSRNEGILIDDKDMRNLPLWCPRISKLELVDCAMDITDESVSYALDKWSAKNITAIVLRGCHLLTDGLLPVIERCCPKLTLLNVQGMKLSKTPNQQWRASSKLPNRAFWLINQQQISEPFAMANL